MYNKELFDYCKHLEDEYNKAFAYGIGKEKWTEKRQALYAHGPLHGLYREHDQFLKEQLEKDAPSEYLQQLVRKYVMDHCSSIERDFKAGYETSDKHCVILEKIRHDIEQKLNSLSESNVIEWINSYNGLILKDLADEPEKVKLRFLELYIEYHYSRKTYSDEEQINTVYDSILAADDGYKKWGLIPITSGRKLEALDNPRIYDASINKTVFLYDSKSVVSVLIELYNKGLIGRYGFLGKSIEDGKVEQEYLTEAIAYGRLFSYDIGNLPNVTKLYSDSDNSFYNQLWVKSEGGELTFEELLKDSETIDGNIVVTQMIHMLYSMEHGEIAVITHLDHEYIYYTKDETNYEKSTLN